MRIAGIVRDSIVDGIGVRDVIFFQGCYHRCKGCQNPQTWNHDGGEVRFTGEVIDGLSNSSNDITISGGEPLDQMDALIRLLKYIRKHTKKRVWLYTGHTVDITKKWCMTLADYVDVVVDGRFVEELKDSSLRFRGSSNQRIIDLPKSIEKGRIIEWEDVV